MNILGIGPFEMLLVLVLALIILGPGKMPEVARSVGKMIREFQRASKELTEALSAEISAEELEQPTTPTGENGRASLPQIETHPEVTVEASSTDSASTASRHVPSTWSAAGGSGRSSLARSDQEAAGKEEVQETSQSEAQSVEKDHTQSALSSSADATSERTEQPPAIEATESPSNLEDESRGDGLTSDQPKSEEESKQEHAVTSEDPALSSGEYEDQKDLPSTVTTREEEQSVSTEDADHSRHRNDSATCESGEDSHASVESSNSDDLNDEVQEPEIEEQVRADALKAFDSTGVGPSEAHLSRPVANGNH